MRKVKAFRWMREHTPRGMEWVCLQIFRCGRGQENIIKARVVSVVAPSAPLGSRR